MCGDPHGRNDGVDKDETLLIHDTVSTGVAMKVFLAVFIIDTDTVILQLVGTMICYQ